MTKTNVSTARFTDEQNNERVQYKTTIPKALAEAYDMEDASLEWSSHTGDKLVVQVVTDE